MSPSLYRGCQLVGCSFLPGVLGDPTPGGYSFCSERICDACAGGSNAAEAEDLRDESGLVLPPSERRMTSLFLLLATGKFCLFRLGMLKFFFTFFGSFDVPRQIRRSQFFYII